MRNIFLLYIFLFSKILLAQFTGGTYTIGTAGGENYTSLKAACDALNAAGSISGEVIFEITSDLTEPNNVALGVNTSGFPITFRPSADVERTITFTQTSANGLEVGNAPLGAFVIGTTILTNYNNLIPTSNITISGLPSGGSTSRLTIRKSGASNSALNYPISVVGNSENFTLSDLVIDFSEGTFLSSDHFAIALITYKDGSGNQYAPDYFTMDNCVVTANLYRSTWGIGALLGGFNGYSYLGDFPDNIVVRNSNFTCQGGAIYLEYFSDIEINNNTFAISSSSASANIYGIKVSTNVGYADVSIHSNQFTQFSSMGTTNHNEYVIGISGNYDIGGSSTIYNNMISGIEKPISSGSGNNLHLINVSSYTASITFNTLYMTNLSSNSNMAAFAPYRGISLSSNMSFNLANNIIFIDEDDFQAVGIYYENTNFEPGGDASDYNNIYRSGTTNSKTGYADTEGGFCSSLSDWQAVSSFGTHSVSKSVSFTSASDLHLSGSSLGDVDLIGTPIGGITTDIDGETRDATFPYIGADENLANPLPVELTSFSANISEKSVVLNWQTATEVNNYGFEIERSVVPASGTDSDQLTEWEAIGFIEGHGNSNSPKEYTFLDDIKDVTADSLEYRLKQIDTDGKFEYYGTTAKVGLANITGINEKNIPTEFALEQNYPNPFNPTTTIKYSIPAVAGTMNATHHRNTRLIVYDILGREISTLVSKGQTPGNYEVKFDAAQLTSGVYFYKISSGSFTSTKKMILLK